MAIPTSKFKPELSNSPGLKRAEPSPEDQEDEEARMLQARLAGAVNMQQLDARFESRNKASRMRQPNKLNLHTASDLPDRKTIWLYDQYLAIGELTVLAGAPGHGKTALTCYLAAAMTRNDSLSFNQELAPKLKGNVIFINTEDDMETSLRTRLIAAGADLTHVHFLNINVPMPDGGAFSVSDPQFLEKLGIANEILEGSLNLIVIDPIYSAVEGDHTNVSKARKAYQDLNKLAKRLNCAVLGVAHTSKNPRGKNALDRITSPAPLREVPRTILLLSEFSSGTTGNGGSHYLVKAKNNIGDPTGGFAYKVQPVDIEVANGSLTSIRFEITDVLVGPADALLRDADRRATELRERKVDRAGDILKSALEAGPRLANDIIELAKQNGISENTLKNAKAKLGILSRKRTVDGKSEWRLADDSGPDDSDEIH